MRWALVLAALTGPVHADDAATVAACVAAAPEAAGACVGRLTRVCTDEAREEAAVEVPACIERELDAWAAWLATLGPPEDDAAHRAFVARREAECTVPRRVDALPLEFSVTITLACRRSYTAAEAIARAGARP